MRFGTILFEARKTATGIEVPPEVIEALGAGKKPAVNVTLNGYQYRSTVGVMGGKFLIPVSAEIRAAAKVAGGDPITVELTLDTAPRTVTVPDDLQAALDADSTAAAAFAKLSPSNKKALVTNLEGAKAAETRTRRLAKIIADLSAGTA